MMVSTRLGPGRGIHGRERGDSASKAKPPGSQIERANDVVYADAQGCVVKRNSLCWCYTNHRQEGAKLSVSLQQDCAAARLTRRTHEHRKERMLAEEYLWSREQCGGGTRSSGGDDHLCERRGDNAGKVAISAVDSGEGVCTHGQLGCWKPGETLPPPSRGTHGTACTFVLDPACG